MEEFLDIRMPNELEKFESKDPLWLITEDESAN